MLRPPKSSPTAPSPRSRPVVVGSEPARGRHLDETSRSQPNRSDEPDFDGAAEHAAGLLRDCGITTQRVETQPRIESTLDWTLSGAMALTGESNAAPRFARGPLATAARGAGLVLSALAPNTSLATLDAPALLGERAAIAGLGRAGSVSAGGSARLLPTRKGVVVVNLPRNDDWSLIPAWLESEAFPSGPDRWEELASSLTSFRHGDLVARGRLMGLAVADAPREVFSDRPWFRLHHESTRSARRPARRLKLLDLSSLWAGPLAASLLAMAGIDVLKIESPERPDGARQGPKAFFDLLNANKAGCALDLASTRDRTIFEKLLGQADIVLESSRPRALEQLGYAAEEWVGRRSGRLWISITGYGRTGPQRDWIAYGDDAAIAAGLAWAPSTEPASPRPADDPCFCADAIADPLTGLHTAAIALALIRAGRGGVLDLSLVDLCANAAGLGAGRLERPVERVRGEGDFVIFDDERIAVAPPRSRIAIATAPRLMPPSDALLSKWASPC